MIAKSNVIEHEIDELFKKRELINEGILSLIKEKDNIFKLIVEKEKELKKVKIKEVPKSKFLYNGKIYSVIYSDKIRCCSVLCINSKGEYVCVIKSELSKMERQNELHRLLKRRGLRKL
ncbi:hypothetical protein [Clostridium algidicarnis]|uniref:hypothetical protein n=1 Tax=Clostridium algidicarnis TaxID=37659 RepID=UPI001C0AA095|nr:hypothetical protein [Clostridium algidicarnis]MBU3203732.1 hypothetical protein [Clostridium algidicarnis]MBU3211886.1 hypothetical protein [Clostridium algidicarnis]MBU3221608.1 hypothetical protein [Clostridium algidicarnis]